MAIFQSDARVLLKRLADKAFQTSQERDHLLAQLAVAEGVRAKDVAWMLFRPDRAYRDAVVAVLKRVADPETVDALIAECRGKPDPAVRAAAATLFTLGVSGTEQRLAEIAIHGKGEAQEIVRRLLLDAPVTPSIEPVLWHLAALGRVEDRLAFLTRLASAPADARALPRWQRLARDPEKAIREKALAVLAQRDPGGQVDLFVEQLPLVDYSTQQVLVDALTRAAAGQGPGFADRLLPLMASGEAGTPSACRTAGRWCGATSSSRSRSPAGRATVRSSR
jgi:HEAT repeat protein